MFFAQNAGGMGSGTGIDKSNVISVINLKDVANLGDGELINATTVPITPGLEMTNGASARRSPPLAIPTDRDSFGSGLGSLSQAAPTGRASSCSPIRAEGQTFLLTSQSSTPTSPTTRRSS